MILSKPLARWAFVCSKYLAQIILYLFGLILSLVGSFIYAYVLFAPGDPIPLLKILALASGLLFLWLLPYVTITLLGSVLASSTSAAAGIAAGGAVLWMLLGSIPQLSGILPGALLTWANQLNLGQPLPATNGGALAASLTVGIIGVITGIAFFENQEL
jgi:ABC-type transport system involved in multi-copper enzyme maturation permease subunit